MSKEINILNYIYENENITQRDIANHVGMSVGGVNLLLKKMAEAGWVRIQALKNPKLVQYILTPEGMREKTAKTYRYITRTYRNILRARQVILTVLEELDQDVNGMVYLYGEKDEVYEIICMIIDEELGDQHRFKYVGSIDKLTKQLLDDCLPTAKQSLTGEATVLIWNPEHNQRFKDRQIPYINILEHIQFNEEGQ